MTVIEVIQRSTEFLQRHGVESPRFQVELLLGHVLKLPRLQLYLCHDRVLAEAELDTLRTLVKRRANREPLQHLIGSTSFCGREIRVSPAALIPRPETETLAELTVAALRGLSTGTPVALDFGTGTGCLAIHLAAECPPARLHAVDLSEPALALAQTNVTAHGLFGRVSLHLGDGFNALPAGLRFDLVVSNPPYIPAGEIAELQVEVRDFDPRSALDGGADGLDFYRRLATESSAWLNPGGGLFAEFGDGQEAAVSALFSAAGWGRINVHRDLTGKLRVVEAWREPATP